MHLQLLVNKDHLCLNKIVIELVRNLKKHFIMIWLMCSLKSLVKV
jgi:hypothetical protein